MLITKLFALANSSLRLIIKKNDRNVTTPQIRNLKKRTPMLLVCSICIATATSKGIVEATNSFRQFLQYLLCGIRNTRAHNCFGSYQKIVAKVEIPVAKIIPVIPIRFPRTTDSKMLMPAAHIIT